MVATKKTSIKLIRGVNSLVDTFVLVVILLLLVFGSYAMWDSNQIHIAASSAQYEIYKPTEANEEATFEELQKINPDVFAWLTVYGTNIDYPVVHGDDNMKYVNTNASGRHSLSGAIFKDYRNSPNFADFNSILYGHHMENNVMFGEIGNFSEKDYFEARRYGTLFFEGQEHGIEFFAFVHADANDTRIFRPNVTEMAAKQKYLDLILDMAIHVRSDVSVTINDRIVLLSTCSSESTNGRDILIAKLIDIDKVPVKPLTTEQIEEENTRATFVIDEIQSLWKQGGMVIKVIIVLIIFLAVILASMIVNVIHRQKIKLISKAIKNK